eukprot:GFYU01004228.1.p1 GENE.GFYU01004228.1~~GFYU01004228.1.p1  ORF type:complete len:375 (-),score=83.20 GFYU01004228.1:374-1498(-)
MTTRQLNRRLSYPADPNLSEAEVRKLTQLVSAQAPAAGDEKIAEEGSKYTVEKEELTKRSELLLSWNYNIFQFKKPELYRDAAAMFGKVGLLTKLKVPMEELCQFFNVVAANYRPNPFHNFYHAFDVTHALYHFTVSSNGILPLLSDIDCVSLFIAGVCHDLDHRGRSNNFLVNTTDPLAELYNNESVLENHHCATAFRILNTDGCRILDKLESDEKTVVMNRITRAILATDMAMHGKILSEVKNRKLNVELEEDKILFLALMLKCADISNPARPFEIHDDWNERVNLEFYAEGDEDRAAGREVNPLHDRENKPLRKSTADFIGFVVKPLYEVMRDVVRDVVTVDKSGHAFDTYLKHLDDNQSQHMALHEKYEK